MTRKTGKKPRRVLEKAELIERVLRAVISLNMRRGHLRWTMSELSRASGVPRTLIYYYLGKTKSGILKDSVRLIGRELAGFNERKLQLWAEGRVDDALLESRKLFEEDRYLIAFFFAHRGLDTEIGREMVSIEREFLGKLRGRFPNLDENHILAMHGLLFGLSFCPGLTPEAVRSGTQMLQIADSSL
jgi:hypothetical protein